MPTPDLKAGELDDVKFDWTIRDSVLGYTPEHKRYPYNFMDWQRASEKRRGGILKAQPGYGQELTGLYDSLPTRIRDHLRGDLETV